MAETCCAFLHLITHQCSASYVSHNLKKTNPQCQLNTQITFVCIFKSKNDVIHINHMCLSSCRSGAAPVEDETAERKVGGLQEPQIVVVN